MMLILKIAFRNLFRHKGRSLIIGIILMAGAFVMTLGNGIITGMEKGFSTNIVRNWTGHILILSARQKNDDALFSPKPVKVIQNYDAVEPILRANPDIESYLPATKGIAMVLNIGDQKKSAELPVLCMLIGVDFPDYLKMFDENISLIEGRAPQNGEKGVIINQHEREKIFDSEGIWLTPKNTIPAPEYFSREIAALPAPPETASNLVLMGIGDENSALDVFADVKGIYQFKSLNLLFKEINIIDLESFRECFEYVTRADGTVEISDENRAILNTETDSYDHYFEQEIMVDSKEIEIELGTDALKEEVEVDEADIAETNKGAYNLVFVKLAPGQKIDKSLTGLNDAFKSKGLDARAVSWQEAVGYISDIAFFFRIALSIFVFFIFFSAIIIIINTLCMATMERIPETATMRAIGAGKGFIGKMFTIETALLSVLFGGSGLITGAGTILFLSGLDITATNEMMSLAFGGDTFCPVFNANSFTSVFIQLSLVTITAVAYPVYLAVKVSPVDAIARD